MRPPQGSPPLAPLAPLSKGATLATPRTPRGAASHPFGDLLWLYDSAVNASHVRKYVADHPDSRPGVGWFTAVVTPELLQKVHDPPGFKVSAADLQKTS